MTSENNIVDIRKRLGLTQAKLAEALDVGGNYVYLLEAGKRNPSKKIIKKLHELEKNSNKPTRLVSENLAKEDPAIYQINSELAMLRTQLQQAHAREKIHLDIIKNLTANTKQP